MGKAFPDHFQDKQNVETEEVEAPQRPAGNVVAPVNRSAKTTQSAANLHPDRTR